MTKQFVQHSRAWYSSTTLRPEVIEEFNLDNGEDRTQEFSVRWYDVPGLETAPKVEAFHDAYSFLFDECSDLLRPLHDVETTPQDFYRRLIEQGWIDVTPTENPYA